MSSRPGRAPLLPLLAAALVRLACLPLGAALPHAGDANGYLHLARELRQTGHCGALEAGLRPPLSYALVTPGLDTSVQPADPFPGVYLIQIGFDLLALWLLMTLTRRRFGPRAAAAAGWIYALYPPAILLSAGVIMAESAAALALAAALLLLEALDRRLDEPNADARGAVLRLGGALGLGILTKELLVPITATVALALMLRPGLPVARRLRLAVAVGGVALLVASPWALWTRAAYGVPVLSGTFGDTSAAVDNVPEGKTSLGFWKELHTLDLAHKLERSHQVFRDALFEYPGLTAQRALARLRIAVGPEDMLPIWIAGTFDGFVANWSSNFALMREAWVLPPGWGRRAQLLCGLAAVVLFALGAAGLVAAGGGLLRRATLLATLVVLLTLALTVSTSRYRHSLVPFWLPFAGFAVALLADRDARAALAPGVARRAALAGVAVAAALTLTIFVLPAP